MFLFLAGVFSYAIWHESSFSKQIGEFLTLPVFTFGAGAFAIDAYIKAGGGK
jgi:hypothetical protein